MDAVALIVALIAVVIAYRNRNNAVIELKTPVTLSNEQVDDIARRAIDRHEQNYHRR